MVEKMKNQILKELNAMREVGIRVPQRAYALLETENLDDYDDMSVSDLADLLIQLAGVSA
jgi:hypothetical protein